MLRTSRPDDPDERKRFTEQQLAARESAMLVHRLDDAAALLGPALRAVQLAGADTTMLHGLLESIKHRRETAAAGAGGPIAPRNRPQVQKAWDKSGPRHRFTLYLDESGGSRLNVTTNQPFFAIGGLLIDDAGLPNIEAAWTAWKKQWIGRTNATMHAKSLGRKTIGYYVKRGADRNEALASLEKLIDEFQCSLCVAAIDKRRFQELYPGGSVNALLPGSHYDICLDFLLERVVYCLLEKDDAHAHVIAEARNRMEDARLQHEYQRLQFEGTLFTADTWFRYQLGPHITFQSKDDNVAGLQLVDVLLRAVVDRLEGPSSDPLRWGVAHSKLYDGGKGRRDGWGLKLFPGDTDLIERVLGRKTETEGAP